jgi:peptide-methionine (S)-S-oxide reductase
VFLESCGNSDSRRPLKYHLCPSDFQKEFPGAIKKARVGFMSPLQSTRIKNPTYKQVCTGQSGHVEVLYVELNDPSRHFEELCRFFFTFHDPTLKERQGNDVGFQYSSWIFCGDDEQFQIAEKVKEELQIAIDRRIVTQFFNKTVQTQITKLSEFTEAHAAHQEYLSKNPNGYCNHRIRLRKWNVLKEKN